MAKNITQPRAQASTFRNPSEYRMALFGSFISLHSENVMGGLILSAPTE